MIAFVTSAEARELDEDMAPLCGAMLQLGVPHQVVVWDDPNVDWGTFSAAIIRSTWDYHTRIDEFLAWVDRTAGLTRLINDRQMLHWNTDKSYLMDLDEAGIPIVPTDFIRTALVIGERVDVAGAKWENVVVKPTVSAGSNDTKRHMSHDGAVTHIRELIGRGKSVMVQPYQDAIDEHGETAMVYMGGEFSHAFYKGPILANGGNENRNSLFVEETIRSHSATSDQRVIGDRVMSYLKSKFDDLPLYARVDLVPSIDGPRLLELEVTEPSLYFSTAPGSVDRFAAMCANRA